MVLVGFPEDGWEKRECPLELIVKEALELVAQAFKLQLVFPLPLKYDVVLIIIGSLLFLPRFFDSNLKFNTYLF